jgi:hypothetical protein
MMFDRSKTNFLRKKVGAYNRSSCYSHLEMNKRFDNRVFDEISFASLKHFHSSRRFQLALIPSEGREVEQNNGIDWFLFLFGKIFFAYSSVKKFSGRHTSRLIGGVAIRCRSQSYSPIENVSGICEIGRTEMI